MDEATFLASVSKTHRAIIVEEAWRSVSISAEVSARIMEKVFYDLDVPVQRLCGAEVPIPYANHLAAIPQVNDIINTVKKIIHHD
jgi:pyruvate dehydrogenase E1 component beta subunit